VGRKAAEGALRFTACYRDPEGKERSAGTFSPRRAAVAAGRRAESTVETGTWINPAAGRITFRNYVEDVWWPSRHLEASTRASYRNNLDRHFLPWFGNMAMASILPSAVQAWVTHACEGGQSARSEVKFHVLLHGIFKRSVRDRVIAHNPCADTELPKVVARKTRILTPAEFDRVLAALPERHRPLLLTDIETGMRWGELIALRPRHIDFLRRTLRVEETIVEGSRKVSPTGEWMIVKLYPKDDEPRLLRVSPELLEVLASRIQALRLERDDLLFPSTEVAGGSPMSRNTFRSRVWLPAIQASGIGFHVRMHDLRHAHASWLLADGADRTGWATVRSRPPRSTYTPSPTPRIGP
jgi:integrase